MEQNKKSYKEGSMIDLAVKGLNSIKGLCEDGKPISQLICLNIILVFFSIGLIIDFYMGTKFDTLAGIVMLIFSFFLAAILINMYVFFVKLFSKKYKIKAVRGSISLLFIALPLAVLGLFYNLNIMIISSLLILLVQLVFMIFASLFFEADKYDRVEKGVKKSIWELLGKLETILGIISALITIGGFIFL